MGLFLILLSFFALFFAIYLVLRVLLLNSRSRKVFRLSKSLGKSVLEAFSTNPDIQRIGKRHPRLILWLKKRLSLNNFFGLPLTILSLFFFYILFLSSGLVIDLLKSGVSVAVDLHLDNLLYYFRNASAVKFFLWVTMFGEVEVAIFFILILLAIFFLLRKRWYAYALAISALGTEIFVYFFKFALNRARPLHAVYLETSHSLPSGHAAIAVVLYGFLGYILYRHTKKRKNKLWVVMGTLCFITLLSFSRLYLGVHFLSDVLFGQTIGLLWLIVGISLVEWKFFGNKILLGKEKITKNLKLIISGLVILGLAFYIFWGVFFIPQLPYQQANVDNITEIGNVDYFASNKFVKYTETLSGATQEPISLIIAVEDEKTFLDIFNKAGWLRADSLNSYSVLKMTKEAIFNHNYSTAPMTPSFWNKQVHIFGFEKATESNTIRQRHHARFWATDLKTSDGKIIYVGTVSLDTGIKWFVTHRISPDIDTERGLLFSDLKTHNSVKNFTEFQLVQPTLGKNFSGDQFFTDGKVYFVEF